MGDSQQPDVDDAEVGPVPISPAPTYTYILLGSIAAVFAAQLIFGDALSTLSLSNLFGDDRSAVAAGFVKPYFVNYHQYWRILTGAAVHGGVLHVVMNGYALLVLGRVCEMLSNRAHLAIVFVLACIGGGLLSLYFLPDGVSVGASGGIVGVMGYITIYAFRRKRFISSQFRRSLLINIAFLAIFGLVLINVVDNYGHLGGLLIGMIYGLIQIPSDEHVDPRLAPPAIGAFGVAAMGLFIASCVLSMILIFDFRNAVIPQSFDAASQSSPAR